METTRLQEKPSAKIPVEDINAFAQFLTAMLKVGAEDKRHGMIFDVLEIIAEGKNPIQTLESSDISNILSKVSLGESRQDEKPQSEIKPEEGGVQSNFFSIGVGSPIIPTIPADRFKKEDINLETVLNFKMIILGAISALSKDEWLTQNVKFAAILSKVWQGSTPERFVHDNFWWLVTQMVMCSNIRLEEATSFVLRGASGVNPDFQITKDISRLQEPLETKSVDGFTTPIPAFLTPKVIGMTPDSQASSTNSLPPFPTPEERFEIKETKLTSVTPDSQVLSPSPFDPGFTKAEEKKLASNSPSPTALPKEPIKPSSPKAEEKKLVSAPLDPPALPKAPIAKPEIKPARLASQAGFFNTKDTSQTKQKLKRRNRVKNPYFKSKRKERQIEDVLTQEAKKAPEKLSLAVMSGIERTLEQPVMPGIERTPEQLVMPRIEMTPVIPEQKGTSAKESTPGPIELIIQKKKRKAPEPSLIRRDENPSKKQKPDEEGAPPSIVAGRGYY